MKTREERLSMFILWADHAPRHISTALLEDSQEGTFIDFDSEMLWLGWNAALDSVEVVLPAKLEAQPYACYEGGWNDALLEAADAIEAAGMRVKR